jgi:adenylylsulfate kinase
MNSHLRHQGQPVFTGATLWLTGLSGAGKTTLAHGLKAELDKERVQSVVLDGDVIRRGLCSDLGFRPEDRMENVRRVAEVSTLFANAGFISICALISPRRTQRTLASKIGGKRFFEIYVETPLEECERRDPKGLYARARAGQIQTFTGVSDAYEPPRAPALTISTLHTPIAESRRLLLDFVRSHILGASLATVDQLEIQ